MLMITCPYCHKKLYATNRQLILKGRPGMVCPTCRHRIYYALRQRLVVMQGVITVMAILACAGLGQSSLPGGAPVKILVLAAVVAAIILLGELCARWISRPARLQAATDRLVRLEKEKEEAQKAAERKKKKHAKKK